MAVCFDQARNHEPARRIDDLRPARRRNPFAHGDDRLAVDDDRTSLVSNLRREDRSTLDRQHCFTSLRATGLCGHITLNADGSSLGNLLPVSH
jgi:hypothetical protein